MFPQSANSSHLTNYSSRRRGLFYLKDAQLRNIGTIDLFELLQLLKSDINYTVLENSWITSYLLEHHISLARVKFRKVLFQTREYDSEDNMGVIAKDAESCVSEIVKSTRFFNSDPNHDTRKFLDPNYASIYSIASLSEKSESDSRVWNNSLNMSFRIDLCDAEIEKINNEIKQLIITTNEKRHKLLAKTENMKFDNREAVNTLQFFRKCVGDVNENDKRGHREQINCMQKFIHKRVVKGEMLVQQMSLGTLNMQKKMCELLKLIDKRKRDRDQMRCVDLSQTEFDIRQQKSRLNLLDKGIVKLRTEILQVGREKYQINHNLRNNKKLSSDLYRNVDNILDRTDEYDVKLAIYQSDVEDWKSRLESTHSRINTNVYPSIGDYMDRKIELDKLNEECKSLKRAARTARAKWITVVSKLRKQRIQAN